jgi:uncharacterized protein (UPF0303 family)
MQGTGPDYDEWIRRKRNVVDRFRHSSALVQSQIDYLGSNAAERYPVSKTKRERMSAWIAGMFLLKCDADDLKLFRSTIHNTHSIQEHFL